MSWDIASLLAKAISLMAMASVVGGVFSLYLTEQFDSKVRQHLLRYVKVGAIIGILASSLYFLIQVGAFSQTGLGGMLDKTMLTILAQSELGYASMSRVTAFVLILSFVVYQASASKKNKRPSFGCFSVLLLIISGLLLAYSFSLIGHVAELNMIAGFAIGFHVLAISLWVGSLYPLWYLCKVEEPGRLQTIMHRFGVLAVGFVTVLILSGVYLLIQLLSSLSEFTSTSYGLIFMLKLVGVMVLLLLGAFNKLRFVPRLTDKNGVMRLKRSITLEMGFAFIILMITAYLTTLVGVGHSG